jgi:hypothetical protein
MLVVADTSPLNYPVLIGHEAILPALYARVLIPPAVLTDLRQARTPEAVRAWVAQPPAWLEVRPPLLTFFLADGQLLVAGALADVGRVARPDLLRQEPQGHPLRGER